MQAEHKLTSSTLPVNNLCASDSVTPEAVLMSVFSIPYSARLSETVASVTGMSTMVFEALI